MHASTRKLYNLATMFGVEELYNCAFNDYEKGNLDDELFYAIDAYISKADDTNLLKLENRLNAYLPKLQVSLQKSEERRKGLSDERAKEFQRAALWREEMKELGVKPDEKDESAPFGSFLFPSARAEKLPREPNTGAEDKVYAALEQHIMMNGEVSADSAAIIEDALRAKQYPGILKQPKAGRQLYRGIRVNREWLENNLHKYDGGNYGRIEGVFKYQPAYKYSSSWTYDERIATRYGGSLEQSKFCVVLELDPSENKGKLLDIEPLYAKIPLFRRYSYEHEIIGFGELVCNAVRWEAGWKK